jgi:hypothetical protein
LYEHTLYILIYFYDTTHKLNTKISEIYIYKAKSLRHVCLSVCLSVCLNALNSKSTERIFMRFSPMDRVIREEGLGV